MPYLPINEYHCKLGKSYLQIDSYNIFILASLIVVILKDEKIQNVLGHCQKDFEGGFTAENLGKLLDHWQVKTNRKFGVVM